MSQPLEMTCQNSHKHCCDACGFVWRHLDDGEPGTEARDVDACHTCPCGREQFVQYGGPKPAEYIGEDRPVRCRMEDAVASATLEMEQEIERTCLPDSRSRLNGRRLAQALLLEIVLDVLMNGPSGDDLRRRL